MLAVLSALALVPAGANAAPVTVTLPCVDAIVVQVNCPQAPSEPAKPACADSELPPTQDNLARERAAVLCLVNVERTKRGLVKLRNNPSLEKVARAYARRLVKEHFFSHVAPDGTTMVDRIHLTSYLNGLPRRWYAGENIAWGTGTSALPSDIVKAWMNSPGHRANILNKVYRDIGLGAYYGTPKTPAGGTYVTDFGRRIR